MTTIALTGAAGDLGRLVAEHLLDRTDPADVILITRRPEAVADLVARGASVRAADFDAPTTLATAFAGVDRLLIISADTVGQRLEGQRAAVPRQGRGLGHVSTRPSRSRRSTTQPVSSPTTWRRRRRWRPADCAGPASGTTCTPSSSSPRSNRQRPVVSSSRTPARG